MGGPPMYPWMFSFTSSLLADFGTTKKPKALAGLAFPIDW
jgi:hypothetical protein